MGRNLVGSCGLLIAIGLACQPAQAGDRKSANRVQEAAGKILVAPKAHAVSVRYEVVGASVVRPFEARSSASANRRASADSERKHASEPTREHQPLTLFRFDSKFGQIAVQPVFGHVNGAQFSV